MLLIAILDLLLNSPPAPLAFAVTILFPIVVTIGLVEVLVFGLRRRDRPWPWIIIIVALVLVSVVYLAALMKHLAFLHGW